MTMIKRTAIMLVVLLAGFFVQAQDKGIQFFEGSWQELLARAKETNKPIFIDVYTVWCGPCKMMDKNIFPLESVGNKYNASFINYKVDAEKGEGVEIAKRYRVNSYPTYLYLKSDGELVFRGGGYSGIAEPFIKDADAALAAAGDPNTVGKMQEAYMAGKKDKTFLATFITKLTSLEMDNSQPLNDYFSQLTAEEKAATGTLDFLADNCKDASSPAFAFVMDKLPALEAVAPAEPQEGVFQQPLSAKLTSILYGSAMKALSEKKYDTLIRVIRYAEKIAGMDEYWRTDFARTKMEYFANTGQPDSLITTAIAFIASEEKMTNEAIKKENDRRFAEFMQPYREGYRDSTKEDGFEKLRDFLSTQYINMTAMKLNEAANYIVNATGNKTLLNRALGWSARASALVPSEYRYLSVSAKLLHKLGNTTKAEKTLQQAIALANKASDKEAVARYQQELGKMKKG